MNMIDIIYKKRDGGALDPEEIRFFVQGYTRGEIPDYQAAALLMAIRFRHLDPAETYALTDAMRHSGDVVDLSGIRGVKVDKHSTGGVGDKTTLVVGPLAAACGVPVAKMSGRGLGFTGGTVDKLEAIPGFRTTLSEEEYLAQVNRIGLAVIGQTASIAPADKKLYALRDVTATVDEIGLITASIMSKKLASGSDAIVLDVKCGRGAFMETEEEAVALARQMVEIGTADGKKTIALVTDMDQPLGAAVGNSLEVVEAIRTLQGSGPADITALSLALAGYMIYAGERARTPEEGRDLAEKSLRDGTALAKFADFVEGQGGDRRVAADPGLLDRPAATRDIPAPEDGFVTGIEARRIGTASQHAGAGRLTKEDPIDLSAGILLRKKVGDPVRRGEPLARVFAGDPAKLEGAAAEAAAAFSIRPETPRERPLILQIVTA